MATVVEYGEDPGMKALQEAIKNVGQSVAGGIARKQQFQYDAAKTAADRAHRTYLEQMGITSREKIAKQQNEATARHHSIMQGLEGRRVKLAEKKDREGADLRKVNKELVDLQLKGEKNRQDNLEKSVNGYGGYEFISSYYHNPDHYKKVNGQWRFEPASDTFGKSLLSEEMVKSKKLILGSKDVELLNAYREQEPVWRQNQQAWLMTLNWLERAKDTNTASVKSNIGWDQMTDAEKFTYVRSGAGELLALMPVDLQTAMGKAVKKAPGAEFYKAEAVWNRMINFYQGHGSISSDDPNYYTNDVTVENSIKRRVSQRYAGYEDAFNKQYKSYNSTGDVMQAISEMEWGSSLRQGPSLAKYLLHDVAMKSYGILGIVPRAGRASFTSLDASIHAKVEGLHLKLKKELKGQKGKKFVDWVSDPENNAVDTINKWGTSGGPGQTKQEIEENQEKFLLAKMYLGNERLQNGVFKDLVPSEVLFGRLMKNNISFMSEQLQHISQIKVNRMEGTNVVPTPLFSVPPGEQIDSPDKLIKVIQQYVDPKKNLLSRQIHPQRALDPKDPLGDDIRAVKNFDESFGPFIEVQFVNNPATEQRPEYKEREQAPTAYESDRAFLENSITKSPRVKLGGAGQATVDSYVPTAKEVKEFSDWMIKDDGYFAAIDPNLGNSMQELMNEVLGNTEAGKKFKNHIKNWHLDSQPEWRQNIWNTFHKMKRATIVHALTEDSKNNYAWAFIDSPTFQNKHLTLGVLNGYIQGLDGDQGTGPNTQRLSGLFKRYLHAFEHHPQSFINLLNDIRGLSR
tara:strand:- start:6040 stop:8430 length:2391 start_codon:yes stop_codon:yes gene_type:complete